MRLGMKQQDLATAPAATGRCSASTRRCAIAALTRSGSTAAAAAEAQGLRLQRDALQRADPGDREAAAQMMRQAQAAVDERYRIYEDLAARDGSRFLPNWESA